jgi:hypothetical protein
MSAVRLVDLAKADPKPSLAYRDVVAGGAGIEYLGAMWRNVTQRNKQVHVFGI